MHDSISHIVIAIIVTDYDYGLSLCLEAGKNGAVEEFLERRILVGGPLVEKQDRTVFEAAGEQCKTLALSLRKRGRGEYAVLHADLIGQPQPADILAGLIVDLGTLQPQQGFKQKEVGKNAGEKLAIAVAVFFSDSFAIEPNVAFIGGVQTHDQFGQRGFSAAVAAGDEE